MPQLGETVAEGTVLKWYKRVGETIRADELLFDVETDKVSMEIPAPAAGVLTEIVVAEGATAKVGERLAVILGPGEKAATPAAASAAPAAASAGAVAASATQPVAALTAEPALRGDGRAEGRDAARAGQQLSPAVRKLSAELGVDATLIAGTGPGGRVTREDVVAYAARSGAAASSAVDGAAPAAGSEGPAAAGAQVSDRVRPLNSIRRHTAEHMARAWSSAPHVLQVVEVDFTVIDKLRGERAGPWKLAMGFSLTFLPFVAKAVTLALERFPNLNSVYQGSSLRLQERINLGIAVDLNLDGLMVPVVKDCQSKSLTAIARAIDDLSRRARAGKLVPDDMTEGTYTLTNNGAFGTVITAPIINVPQVAILSVDGIRKKPVVVESPDGDRIEVGRLGMLAQSFDHRAVDGAYSASFLAELKSILQTRDWVRDLT